MVDATLAALADLPEAARRGAHLVFVTHSIPDVDERRAAGRAAAPTSPSTATSRPRSPSGSREETGHRLRPRTWSSARAPGRRRCRGSSPTSTTTSSALRRRRRRGAVVLVPIGFVSDHMEVVYDLDTEARETAERLGLPLVAGGDRRASTRGSSRWCATCSLERAAVERGEPVERRRRSARTGRLGPVRRRAAAPTPAGPARRCAGGTERVPDDGPADADDLLDLAAGRRARGGRAGRRGCAAAGVEVAGTKSSPIDIVTEADRACEELVRERLLGGPARRRVRRRGGQRARRAPAGCAGSSTRSTAP